MAIISRSDSMVNPSPYTVGGTVQANQAGLYLTRQADTELLQLCQQGSFAYVLTPRQMGKSSLMIRTAEQLMAAGTQAVIIDLTQIGTGVTADQWYIDFLDLVASQLYLSIDGRAWWQAQTAGNTLRLTRFFQEVVLAEV
ncbi:MAG: AAA-like domain-containing protein, partial [Nodosilinea sp.]